MSTPSRENALDHVVVVMFENRSFDNLLGRLYEPGEVASFEGVIGKELSNRVPDWAEHRPQDGIVSYAVAANMNTPSPDSGEEYPHINTQLFGTLDEENRFKLSAEKSFNEPRDGQPPTMDGFLADYISVLTEELGRQPTVEEYCQIMSGYTPEQMPVLSAIARGFATFDHWFCDVPTCTYPNRSFFHAGASSGFVVNTSPPGSFPSHNDVETLFDRLDAAGLTWKVYCDPPSHYSLTGIIHAPRLASRFATNFFSTRQFFQDAEMGELPTYSFIEPQIIGWNHNDMHPPFGAVVAALGKELGADDATSLHFDPPSSLIGGEDLLARIYDAVRSSSSATGSNHLNTTLLVTFDEHGGTYDHEAIARLVETAVAEHGRLDVLVNNAGLGGTAPLEEMSDEEWDRVLDVTLTGTFRCTRAALRRFRQQAHEGRPGGAIVNNASVLGWRAQHGQAHYAAAKAGVMALTRCAAVEAADMEVRVNAVAPSLAMHPFLEKVTTPELLAELTSREAFGRAAEPWEVANTIVFLASDYASYLTGEVLSVSNQHP